MRVPPVNVWGFQFPHKHLFLSVFLIIVILVWLKWNLTVVWICISLMTNIECFFMCLLALEDFCIHSLGRSLFRSFACFENWVAFFSWKSSLYILGTNTLSDMWLANIYPILWDVFLVPWWCSLKHKTFKYWWSLIYQCFLLLLMLLMSYLRRLYLTQDHEDLFFIFFPKSFIVLTITFRSMIHFFKILSKRKWWD